MTLDRQDILRWLCEDDPRRLEELWRSADAARREYVGDAVHLRALVELSNHCIRRCGYCGLRSANGELQRYRMSHEEILAAALHAGELGYGTIVMQAGEDPGLTRVWMTKVIEDIKAKTKLAVSLSLGERSEEELAEWRRAGADRYLLRFETSDAELYRLIHPSLPRRVSDRIRILRNLRELGYEVGSGIMLGIPGQTLASVADDIALFRELDLDMIGIGPYIEHPATPLANGEWTRPIAPEEQVPASEEIVYKAVALTRLMCPGANIPSTTALATINRVNGRELALARGANVVMPNLTPPRYREFYQIYPGKACIGETGDACSACLAKRIQSMGRTVGRGPGGRRRLRVRAAEEIA